MLDDAVGARSLCGLKARLEKHVEEKSIGATKKTHNHIWLTESSKLKVVGDLKTVTENIIYACLALKQL